jgi:hypothetical protein
MSYKDLSPVGAEFASLKSNKINVLSPKYLRFFKGAILF